MLLDESAFENFYSIYLSVYRHANYLKVVSLLPPAQNEADGNFNNSPSLSVFDIHLYGGLSVNCLPPPYDVRMNNACCIILHKLQVTEGEGGGYVVLGLK